MNYEYLTIEDAERLAKNKIDEEIAVEYLNSLDKRAFMTMNEVDLANLVIKYKKEYFGLLELYNIHVKDLEEKDKEIDRLKDLYEKTCKHLFNIGNDELARYFQAQINECNVFVPQDLRGEDNESN